MTDFLIIAGLLTVIFGLYFISYKLNKSQAAPTEDEPLYQCASCAANGSCSIQDKAQETEQVKNDLREILHQKQ